MKSSVPKVAAKSLNIFEFQVLVKLQAFSLTENYLLFLVFFQGVLKADLEILSDLRWYFGEVADRWKSLSIFARFLNLPLLFSFIPKQKLELFL